MKYDFAVVVGRFQPYHKIHHKMLTYALSQAERVIVILGSAYTSPDHKNPFTAQEREEMIRASFIQEDQERLSFHGIRDYNYNNNLWLTEVQNIAMTEVESYGIENPKVGLIGHFKDESSFYLNQFPQWKLEDFNPNSYEGKLLNATDIRILLFESEPTDETWAKISSLVPIGTFKFLKEFVKTEKYQTIADGYIFNKNYQADYSFVNSEHSPTFVTTDALVVCSGHVLIIKRGHHPGKGKLALPGGFLAKDELIIDNAIKELHEETKIKVPTEKLKDRIVDSHVFDFPYRSLRGRTITHAYYIELSPDLAEGLPHVSRKGGDDAAGAFWISIANLRRRENEMFEDHMDIVRHFLGF